MEAIYARDGRFPWAGPNRVADAVPRAQTRAPDLRQPGRRSVSPSHRPGPAPVTVRPARGLVQRLDTPRDQRPVGLAGGRPGLPTRHPTCGPMSRLVWRRRFRRLGISPNRLRNDCILDEADLSVVTHRYCGAEDATPLRGWTSRSARSPGPGSKPINVWSLFTAGLQSACSPGRCRSARVRVSVFPALDNGMRPLAGGLSLYRNGEAPAALHADQVLVRGVRLPYVKYPGFPNLWVSAKS